jgi:hypothetical protein
MAVKGDQHAADLCSKTAAFMLQKKWSICQIDPAI